MPDLVKVGITGNLEARVKELSRATGVPVPFEVHYACTVREHTTVEEVEMAVLEAFADHRINPKREFLRVDPERIVAMLGLVAEQDTTPQDDYYEDAGEHDALERERARRVRFKFQMVKLRTGTVLTFFRNESITATVHDDSQIVFNGQVTSLTNAAREAFIQLYGRSPASLAGPRYWVYQSETLSERRRRLEEESMSDNDFSADT